MFSSGFRLGRASRPNARDAQSHPSEKGTKQPNDIHENLHESYIPQLFDFREIGDGIQAV
jgi:hypothetical protein